MNRRLKSLVLGIPLIFASTLVVSLLAFSGMEAIYPGLSYGISAAILAGVIEGEVVGQNIASALTMISYGVHYLEHQACQRKLLELSKKNTEKENLYYDYLKFRGELRALEQLSKRNEKDKDKIKNLQKLIADIEAMFRLSVYKQEEDLRFEAKGALFGNQEKNRLKAKIKRNNTVGGIGLVLLAPTACFAYTLLSSGQLVDVLPVFLPHLAFASISWMVWPLAILAGIEFSIRVSKTLISIIDNETVQKIAKMVRDAFKSDKTTLLKKLRIAFGSLTLVSLVILATLFTVGTWWNFAQTGVHLVPGLKRLGAKLVSVLIPIAGTGELLFSLENTGESVKNLGVFNLLFRSLKHRIAKAWKEESTMQFFNPFRFAYKVIDMTWRLSFFTLHVLSIGLTGDRFPGIPSYLTAIISAGNEGLVDLHYVAEHTEDGGYVVSDQNKEDLEETSAQKEQKEQKITITQPEGDNGIYKLQMPGSDSLIVAAEIYGLEDLLKKREEQPDNRQKIDPKIIDAIKNHFDLEHHEGHSHFILDAVNPIAALVLLLTPIPWFAWTWDYCFGKTSQSELPRSFWKHLTCCFDAYWHQVRGHEHHHGQTLEEGLNQEKSIEFSSTDNQQKIFEFSKEREITRLEGVSTSWFGWGKEEAEKKKNHFKEFGFQQGTNREDMENHNTLSNHRFYFSSGRTKSEEVFKYLTSISACSSKSSASSS